ncbi:hypothetical protein [Candidatus Odyssella acanthamoebae]|uniref:Uncharacterized protein n=1 Tax=Candidatus Odyssella acanthamoebae TaxID=91604 RepID=A0A077AX89_9PROT|nr:hypothetical protein [Candidatus Paracaedibacter acanthamoebae]AIK96238.1 hypothetical protein ID47_04990 [Candidatus Paracaedibacter acanthamoebae]
MHSILLTTISQQMRQNPDEKVWQTAILKEGGLWIFGDFLFQEYSRYGHNLTTELAGHMASIASDVLSLYESAKNGDWGKTKKESLKFLKRNTPGHNLFYLEPTLALVGGK